MVHWKWFAATWLLVWALQGCGGCARPSVETSSVDPEESLPVREGLFAYAGELDIESRYASTVTVRTFEPREAGAKGRCSGVLIGPKLVLTAGHCVCTRRQVGPSENQQEIVVTGSDCAQAPVITTIIYDAPLEDLKVEPGFRSQSYKGVEVRTHPEFKLVLDRQGRVTSGEADLAVIVLDRAVEETVPVTLHTEGEVQARESIVVAGYTYDEVVGGIHGQRRFNHYRVTESQVSSGGRILFEQPGRQVYRGDSGGPCLRRGGKGEALVGISGRGLAGEAAFTSTYHYRAWLRAELERAGGRLPAAGSE